MSKPSGTNYPKTFRWYFFQVHVFSCMSCPSSQNHYFWWLWSGCSPLPIPNREVKPRIADDTALVCGKVGRRQFFIRAFREGCSFFAQVPRLHHGRGALQLADEDLLHWIRFNSAVFRSPYGVSPGSRRTLRRHRAQRQTALRGI